jgi:hypothetical protein
MAEMIERVSAAIERIIEERPMVEASPAVIRKLVADKVARAAIEAMREPTEAMEEAGFGSEWHVKSYQAMIDDALA